MLLWLVAAKAEATIVRYDTVLGSFDVRFFDTATPLTVENFLMYSESDVYVDSFVHRSVNNFVIQGGGFTFDDQTGLGAIDPNDPVMNEPGISNIRGSISMAKSGGNPNSATTQWFFSVNHNTANLDNQNGGFTVFGIVLGDGMTVVDAISDLPTVFVSSPTFTTVPVINFSGGNIFKENLAIINSISILDVPEGDFDLDGVAGQADLAIWESDYGRLGLKGGDFNDDKEIGAADLAIWEANYQSASSAVNYEVGDTEGNRRIDGLDFLTWQVSAGRTTDVAADADGDARITGLDFLMWQQSHSPPPLAGLISVPEPSSLVLLSLGLLFPRRSRS